MPRWLAESSRIPALITELYGDQDREARITATVQENVLIQLENLGTFECAARHVESGKLKRSGWVFKIATGDVFNYDRVSGQFARLADGEEREPSVLSSRPPPAV